MTLSAREAVLRRSRFALLSLLVVVTALLVAPVFVGQAAASPGALRIVILYADSSEGPPSDLQGAVAALPGVAAVDVRDVGSSTPSLPDLQPYDEVVASDSDNPADTTQLGNVLADYQDQGGVVVATEFLWQSSGDEIAGRWLTGGYSPYIPAATGGSTKWRTSTLGSHDTSSPLLSGVNSLGAFYRDDITLATGATAIAQWDDGLAAVAYKGHAVGINGWAGENGSGHSWNGDWAQLIVNAGNVFGRQSLTVNRSGSGTGVVSSSPAGIACGANCSASFTGGTQVALAATPAAGSTFAGWNGGGCSGTGPCTVTMDAAKTVTATFNAIPIPPFGGLTLSGKTVTVKHGKVTLTVTCPATSIGNCIGTDTLATASKVVAPKVTAAAKKKKAKILKLGRGKFSIAAGKSGKVTIKLNKLALKLLAKKHTLKVKQTIVAHDSRNVSKKTSGSLKLKAAKQKKKH